MSDELIRKSGVIDLLNSLDLNLIDYDLYSQLFDTVDNTPPVNAVELPCKVGDMVYIVERDENRRAVDVTGYMFLAVANEAVICTSFINNLDDVDDTIQFHIEETAEDWVTELAVFPMGDCFLTREEAEKALEDLKNG